MSKRKRPNVDVNFQCIHCQDPSSQEELIALIDKRFNPVTGSKLDDLNLKILQFIIHNEYGVCSLEDGLIEKGEKIHVCGRLSSIYSDDCNESLSVKMIGPLNEWWFYGFDGSPSLLVGIESHYSCYILQEPHDSYRETFEELNSKMFLTKFVIEILQENPNCNFEILISKLENKSQQFNVPFLLTSLNFLIDHIKSYDAYRDSDELHLCETNIFKILNQLSGYKILLNNFRFHKSISNFKNFKSNQTLVIDAVNTENSMQTFDQILNNIIKNSEKHHIVTNENFSSNGPNLNIDVGCFVKIQINNRPVYGRIISKNEHSSQKSFHLNLFILGNDTFLGETLSKNILFVKKKCIDVDCSLLPFEIINVQLKKSLANNYETDYFICFQIYDEERCVLESLPLNYISETKNISCFGCSKIISKQSEQNYKIGDCVLLTSNNVKLPIFNYFKEQNNFPIGLKNYDEKIYPERHRKKYCDLNKDNYEGEDFVSNYTIGYIQNIIFKENQSYLKLNIFYRPENVFEKFEDFIKCDLNLLFWSEKTCQVETSSVYQKCHIIYSENITYSLENEEFFYFNLCYDTVQKKFYKPSEILKSEFEKNMENFKFKKSLNILDLFSGCGGLSFGFAPLASKLFAIEKEKSAAQSYKKNYDFSTVFNSDANLILKILTDDKKDEFFMRKLPTVGAIDLIIGGPPCQGFSEMNRFLFSDYSLFKRSSVGCYLNYIDFYKPKYFLFENVYNMIHYGKSLIFKIFCSFMIHIGYQLRIAILQAGCYGLPQNRRRLFIIGARQGLQIPEFPFPTHIFSSSKLKTSFKINEKKFDPFNSHKGTLRMITIEDAIGDLIELDQENYFIDDPRKYKNENGICHYQKMLRTNNVVFDHYCKALSQLNIERIKRIPYEPGSDWRDLPNIKIKLSDGQVINKLRYCSTRGKKKKQHLLPKQKQKRTLIPWCLAHTADKNNHWPGLYGRLSWKGFFPTIVTNPDPISTQGKIIHPDQHRIISIREMARSQGFPDDFIFFGTVGEKYSQIGNAVPPILSIKLAKEFAKCLQSH